MAKARELWDAPESDSATKKLEKKEISKFLEMHHNGKCSRTSINSPERELSIRPVVKDAAQ